MDHPRTRLRALLSPLLATLAVLLAVSTSAWAGIAPAAGAPPAAPPANDGGASFTFDRWFQSFLSDQALDTAVHIVGAIVLFIVGWIVAKLLSYAVLQVLGRTSVDNKIADKLGISMLLRERKGEAENAVEQFIAGVVYWVVMLLVVIGVLDYAGLEKVANPIEGLVAEVTGALPNIGKAILILLVAYVAARILRIGVTRLLGRVGIDRRFAELTESKDKGESAPFSEAVGRVLFWLIMLVGIAGAFESLEIGPIADPMHNAINQIVGILPHLGKAAVLVLIGYFGGRIVRALIRNVLQGLGFDKLIERFQLDKFMGATSASDVVGIAAMVFIILQASIAALNEIGLETLSGPLTAMMGQFWNLLPALAVSVVIILVGVFVGQLLRRVVAGTLRNLGLDRFMEKVGFNKLAEREDRLGEYSELVGYAVHLGIILLAVAQALDNLTLDTWAGYVNALLGYVVKNIAVATVVVGVGFAIGNYVRDLVRARGEDESQAWVAEFARYAVLVFAVTMAVRQLDVAEDFVLMTFGLLFGALCLGAALAFGLGGREVASDILKRRYDRVRVAGVKPRAPAPKPAAPKPTQGDT